MSRNVPSGAAMAFVGTGKRLAQGDIGDAARVLGIETAVLLAFLEVETGGRGFDSRNRPKMLFEPHVFWRNLGKGPVRDKAQAAGLAYARWKRSYPPDSYPRLEQATRLAREAAFRSASYGLPQILGENHAAAGFGSAEAMFSAMKQGEREQLLAMVTLLQSWGLADKLRGKDFSKAASWVPAVSIYNGSGYAANDYHTKAAAAYRKHTKGETMTLPTTKAVLLVRGMKGEAVRSLQADLAAAGYDPGPIDGRFGEKTEAALLVFQRASGLVEDGKAGKATLAALGVAVEAAAAVAEAPAVVVEDHEVPIGGGGGDRPPVLAIVIIALLALLSAVAVYLTKVDPAAALEAVPLPRPAPLLGQGGGVWGGIGLEIALALVEPLAAAAATAAVGWVTWLWQRWLKTSFDQRSADQLHAALERGILAGIQMLGRRASADKLLGFSADYAQQFNAGTVKRFGLTGEALKTLAAPHLAAIRGADK